MALHASIRTLTLVSTTVALAACGAASSSNSNSHSPAASKPAPLQGGVEYLDSSRKLNAELEPMFSDLQTKTDSADYDAAAADVRQIRTAIYNWDLKVRKLTIAQSARQKFNELLEADRDDIAALDEWGQSTNRYDFLAGQQKENTTGNAASQASAAVLEALDAQTLKPTRHMTPGGLPSVVKPSDSTEFPQQSTARFHISPEGANQTRWAATARQLSLSTERVEADVSVDGNVEPGLLCLTSGSGSTPGASYSFTVSPARQAFVVQRIDGPSQYTVLYKGDSSAIKSGDAMNHLRVDCMDGYLTFSVNSKAIFQTYDTAETAGNAGVTAISADETGGVATYENFAIEGR
ncbi:MAG TPA: hypothetical protein VJU79_02830 [Candidatus Dormibacteraeota bacterium]|nr:hypothetical protein [Candidatus Dormibacteraeota bacterium]